MDPGRPRFRRAGARPRDPRSHPEHRLGARHLGTEHQGMAVGESANEGTLTVVLLSGELGFLRREDGKLVESRDDEVVEGRVAKNSVVPRNSAAAIHDAHSR